MKGEGRGVSTGVQSLQTTDFSFRSELFCVGLRGNRLVTRHFRSGAEELLLKSHQGLNAVVPNDISEYCKPAPTPSRSSSDPPPRSISRNESEGFDASSLVEKLRNRE